MAAFRDEPSSWERLDYQALRDGALLYFSNDVLERDVAWLMGERYETQVFDCRTWKSELDFHRDVAVRLRFPDYYGENLDAFNDCMRDLAVPDDGGTVLVFRGIDAFHRQRSKVVWHMVDILLGTAHSNLLLGRRLLTFLQSDDPRFSLEPAGAWGVKWNRREWLDANRGL
ncbi:MAG: barstar family protein [Polyangiaceae bacterium]|nr:barstar family protein [Polyangiaceae bacterium]